MGRTSMDPPPNNGRGSAYSYGRGQDVTSQRSFPAESVRSHPPVDGPRSSYPASNRGSYYPPESQRGYPPESQRGYPESQRGYPESQRGYPESQRGYPAAPESHRSYPAVPPSQRSFHQTAESQRSFPLESHRSYTGEGRPDNRSGLYDKIVLVEMLLASLFGIFGIATMNWRSTGVNIFNSEQESYWLATRALVMIGVVGMVVSLIISIIIVVQRNLRRRPVLWAGFIFQIIGVACMLLGCSVFGHHECGGRQSNVKSIKDGAFDNNCGYSFWFAAIAIIFSAQGLVFHFFAMRTKY